MWQESVFPIQSPRRGGPEIMTLFPFKNETILRLFVMILQRRVPLFIEGADLVSVSMEDPGNDHILFALDLIRHLPLIDQEFF